VTWSERLLDSFRRWTGRDLVEREGAPSEQAGTLFFATVVVVSHGLQRDPILNYGNRAALELWETDWQTLTQTPSRLTAEPHNRPERERMLAHATEHGFVENYHGIRISLTGRRFDVEDALVWNVIGPDGGRCGQAAAFSRWRHVDDGATTAR
jgi:hypothetical protein